MTPRTTLLDPVQRLTQALTTPTRSPISTLLSTFTTQPTPLAHEHGLPQLAPFLGRSFTGLDGVARYFELLADHLAIHDMAFEPDESWVVDDTNQAVTLRGSATFEWKATRQAWDETFVYRVALAEDASSDPLKRGSLRVWEYRVWADSGAAYLARLGRLGELLQAGAREGGGGRAGVEGIHLDYQIEVREATEKETKKKRDAEAGRGDATETRKSRDRKKSGCQDVLGSGLNVYGSCG
ncbi:hypothetical protein NUU61_000616 [Penicillium alfredii]|uniref:Uncharacterized protein n=1 Tax=Penicillium alfredii TaxID=1506179 RepID=A0A9W9KR23_9EURO|nr:uncharacterized protein NUU61_000616 [Penicillium alfredii]KAJ5114857.1 hypothetical protein NUU61_000616 [Penicillium alfredii]